MTTATTTISRRNRNLAIGWTTNPVRDPETGRLAVDTPAAPAERGGAATLRRQLEAMKRVCGTDTYHRFDLFVGGKRVVSDRNELQWMLDDLTNRYEEPGAGGEWTVELEEA